MTQTKFALMFWIVVALFTLFWIVSAEWWRIKRWFCRRFWHRMH